MSVKTTTTTALASLSARGVAANVAAQIAAQHAESLVIAWCEYATRNASMGPGALIEGIRSGQEPPSIGQRDRLLNAQVEYGRQITAWLVKLFPEFDRPGYGPHPAATAEVIRLHWRHGKGRLTKRAHGPAIRAAVKRWVEEHGE
jgi:hypothetical protein